MYIQHTEWEEFCRLIDEAQARGYTITATGPDNDGGDWAYLTRSKFIYFPISATQQCNTN